MRTCALATLGQQNLTRISNTQPFDAEGIETLAREVAKKSPDKAYFVVETSAQGTKNGLPLFSWHVGEGFSHAEGWWVEIE